MGRLKLRKIIPNEINDNAVQTKAVLVLEAFINLIGEQLTYLKTFGSKPGILSLAKSGLNKVVYPRAWSPILKIFTKTRD